MSKIIFQELEDEIKMGVNDSPFERLPDVEPSAIAYSFRIANYEELKLFKKWAFPEEKEEEISYDDEVYGYEDEYEEEEDDYDEISAEVIPMSEDVFVGDTIIIFEEEDKYKWWTATDLKETLVRAVDNILEVCDEDLKNSEL